MANISVDTKKMQESGRDILNLANELNEAIQMLYSKISSITTTSSGVWVGNSATEFVRRANVDKKQYIELKNQLAGCGKFLIETADKYDASVNSNRI